MIIPPNITPSVMSDMLIGCSGEHVTLEKMPIIQIRLIVKVVMIVIGRFFPFLYTTLN